VRRAVFIALLCFCSTGNAEPPLESGVAHQVTVVPTAGAPVRGPRFAPVTLDVYLAVGQPLSSQLAELARRAVERAPLGDVREVVHVVAIGAPGADLAALAADEADAQGRFFPFLDRLLAERSPSLTRAELLALAAEVGLDRAPLEARLSSRPARPRSDPRLYEAPGRVLVNGRPLYALSDEDALLAAIEEARAEAQALLASGVPLGSLYERLVEPRHPGAPHDLPAPTAPPRPRRPRAVLPDGEGAPGAPPPPSRGPSLAPVTLMVFSNLSCPACLELAALARRVAAEHPGAVRVVWRHWAPPYFDPASLNLPTAAEVQGLFWRLHDLAVSSQAHLPLPLDVLAQRAGLDLSRMREDQRAGRLGTVVSRDLADARRLTLLYAPALVVNGVVLSGQPSPSQSNDLHQALERLIRDELDKGFLERGKDRLEP
jgi:protein-disulfide isomerase